MSNFLLEVHRYGVKNYLKIDKDSFILNPDEILRKSSGSIPQTRVMHHLRIQMGASLGENLL